MEIPSTLLETGLNENPGTHKMADVSGCAISIVNHSNENNIRSFSKVERKKNNRVLILASGDAFLVVCENGDKPGDAFVTRIEQNTVYTVPKNVWHQVVLKKDSQVFMIEKPDKADQKESEELENYVIRSCWREFNFSKKKKVKKKKAGSEKKMSKAMKKHLDSIQQLSIWPEFQ